MAEPNNRRDIDTAAVALTIHGFTIGHAVVAGILGPFAGLALTPMTTAMVVVIAWIAGAQANIQVVVRIVGLFVAKILGVGIAETLLGMIPVIGNLANAAASAAVTELIGWAIFAIFRDNLDQNDQIDIDALLAEAQKTQADNAELMNQIRQAMDRMSYRDKRAYKECMKTVRDRDVSAERRNEALKKARELMEQYGVKFPDDKPTF